MTDLPPILDLTDNATTEATYQIALATMHTHIGEIAGSGVYESLTIASGIVTPALGNIIVDTEAADPTDDLDNIIPSTIGHGLLYVRSANAARIVTLKHNVAGSGKLTLKGSVDITLTDPNKFIILEYILATDSWNHIYTSEDEILNDITPQLGGNLDVNGKSIVSISNGNIPVAPHGTGKIILAGLNWPTSDGTVNQVIGTDGSGNLTFQDGGAGNKIVDTFVDGIDYTSGSTTFLTLSDSPGSDNNVDIHFDGIYQEKTEYGVAGTAVTFTSAIPLGVTSVEAVFGSSLPAGTPSDASVTFVKMSGSAIADEADAIAGTATDKLMVAEQVKQSVGANIFSNYMHIQDQKVPGTSGGTVTSATWHPRDLNTILTDNILGALLVSNEVILPKGKYKFKARAPVYNGEQHKLKLYNVTDATDVAFGSSEYAGSSTVATWSEVNTGEITIAATKTFRLEHYTTGGQVSNGLGVRLNIAGVIEIYTNLEIWKIG